MPKVISLLTRAITGNLLYTKRQVCLRGLHQNQHAFIPFTHNYIRLDPLSQSTAFILFAYDTHMQHCTLIYRQTILSDVWRDSFDLEKKCSWKFWSYSNEVIRKKYTWYKPRLSLVFVTWHIESCKLVHIWKFDTMLNRNINIKLSALSRQIVQRFSFITNNWVCLKHYLQRQKFTYYATDKILIKVWK